MRARPPPDSPSYQLVMVRDGALVVSVALPGERWEIEDAAR
jgi:hypothetical protein